jgi:hypothetical protein
MNQPASTPTPDPGRDAQLEQVKRRNRARNTRANAVTAVMVMLTLVVLAYIAYQINHPVTIYISRLFGR